MLRFQYAEWLCPCYEKLPGMISLSLLIVISPMVISPTTREAQWGRRNHNQSATTISVRCGGLGGVLSTRSPASPIGLEEKCRSDRSPARTGGPDDALPAFSHDVFSDRPLSSNSRHRAASLFFFFSFLPLTLGICALLKKFI